MSVPPSLNPEGPAPSTPTKSNNRAVWIILGVLFLLTILAIGALVVGVLRLQSLDEKGPHDLPSKETLAKQMVAYNTVFEIAYEKKYPTEDKPDESLLNELNQRLESGPWKEIADQEVFVALSQSPDLESDEFWSNYYMNEVAVTLAWSLGLVDSLPPITRDAYLPPSLAEPDEAKFGSILKAANRRSIKSLAAKALEYEAWVEALDIYHWQTEGELDEYTLKLYVDDLEAITEENDIPLLRSKDQYQYLLEGVPFNEVDEDTLYGAYWRAFYRAKTLAWVRGYAKSYAEAEPQGPYSYLENSLNRALSE